MYVTFGVEKDVPMSSHANAGPSGDYRIKFGHTSGGVTNRGGSLPFI